MIACFCDHMAPEDNRRSIATGEAGFDSNFGMSFWDYIREHDPETEKNFGEWMKAFTQLQHTVGLTYIEKFSVQI